MIKMRLHYSDEPSKEVGFKFWKFPGGEVGVRIEPETIQRMRLFDGVDRISLTLNWEGSDDLLVLMNLVDAIRRETLEYRKPVNIALRIPYFPYARQDRVCNEGESHALKVFANAINSMNFEYVLVIDPHSNVLEGLVDRVSIIRQDQVVGWTRRYLNQHNTVLIAPDEGAMKKTYANAKALDINRVITCFKQRDLKTGNILGIKPNVSEDFKTAMDFIVFDDICDGGRTFQELYPVLRNITYGRIMLHVTHGIFSKGIEPLLDYDQIFTVNLMGAVNHEKLIVNQWGN